LINNSIKCNFLEEIKHQLSENEELVKIKLLPQAREEMVELLKKEEEQLVAGDKDCDFSKNCIFLNISYLGLLLHD